MSRIKVTLDTAEFDSALVDLTTKFPDAVLEVVYGFVRSPQLFPKLFRIEVDRLATTDAGNVRTVLKPTDFYRQLVLAMRALEVDGLVVEETRHG